MDAKTDSTDEIFDPGFVIDSGSETNDETKTQMTLNPDNDDNEEDMTMEMPEVGVPNEETEWVDFFATEQLLGEQLELRDLETLRINEDEKSFIPISFQMAKVTVHFVDDPDFKGYTRCNGQDCALCQSGMKSTTQFLMPGYCPDEGRIMLLPIGSSRKPYSLFSQMSMSINKSKRQILFIARSGYKYSVSARPVPKDLSIDEDKNERFLKEVEEGKIRLEEVYQRIDNETLKTIPKIYSKLLARGKI